MDTDRCLALLELESCASVEEVRRAYRDLVRVWHPDRFSSDPRLRTRAEEKVKQLNAAYEELIRQLDRSGGTLSRSKEKAGIPAEVAESSTEAFFEAGTRNVLAIWYSLGRALRQAVQESYRKEIKEKTRKTQRKP